LQLKVRAPCIAMGKKRPVNATVDELNEVKAELQAAIDQLRAEAATKAQSQGDRSQLESQIAGLHDQLNTNAAASAEANQRTAADAKEYADAAAAGALGEAQALINELDAKHLSAETAIDEKINSVDQAMRAAFVDELTSLCENLDKRLAELSQELIDRIELRAAQASEALLAQRQELDGILQRDRDASNGGQAQLRREMTTGLESLRNEMSQAHDKINSNATRSRSELDERLDLLSSSVYQNHCDATGGIRNARKDATTSLRDFRAATEHHLAELDHAAAVLADGVSEVKNAATRRVEWLIEEASKTLKLKLKPSPGSEGHASWFSPKFHAAGARNLQLELRYFSGEATADGNSAGDCALYLWGNKGLSIAFRLFIGSKGSTLEKVYSDCVPCGTKRLCSLRDQICKENDTLRVGVELLELVCEDQAPETLADGEARTTLSPDSAEANGDGGAGPFEGSLTCHRHVNNRVLPSVRKEVDRMQSRMVKRIEWLLEQASALPQYFPNRQHICSPVFSAAGIDGMQLMLYPSGYLGTSDGYCALYLFCPSGVTLRGHLSVGKQKREANYTFNEAGAFGRSNFCRYDGLADESTDTLLLVLEIDECRQDITTVVGDPPPIRGEIKLTKLPNQVSLQDTKVLPSLWSGKALGEVGKGQDAVGYHSFSSLKSRTKQPGSGKAGPAAEPAAASDPEEGRGGGAGTAGPATPASTSVRRTSSTPLLGPGGGGQSPSQVDTLPALNTTQSSSEWGGERGTSRTRKSRTSRRPASLAAPPLLAAAAC